jgi:beta-lactamase regulating signal transducer with metallopeptidase domain
MISWLAETTVIAAALAVAVALLCRKLRPRPAVRHALWLVVLLKLLAPPLVAWPWPEPPGAAFRREPAVEESPRPPPADDSAPALPPPEALVAAPPVDDPAWEAQPEPEPPAVVSVPAEAPAPVLMASRSPAVRWGAVVLGAWAAGAVAMALLQSLRIARFRRRLARAGPAPPALSAAVRELAARLGVRPPPVRVVAGLASPVVWGLGRPRLLWPAALLGRLSSDSERAAIVHELAHLRRRDHWVGWLQLLASCAWWWSPLFWHVRRQLGRAAELACDACVIEVLPTARRAYAEALLEVCELVSRRAAPAPALGMGGDRQEIERRLTMILRESVPSQAPVRALFGVVLLALIALPGLTTGQDTPSRTTERPATRDYTVPVADPAAKAPGVDEREQRLQKLEANLEALLREVKELRGGKTTAAPAQPAGGKAAPRPQPNYFPAETSKEGAPVHKDAQYAGQKYTFTHGAPANKTVTLTRATYALPKDKADALAALLKDLKGVEVEAQVKADGIVVTTTPEAQRVVGEFIDVLQGKAPPTYPHAPAYYPPYNTSSGYQAK